jgi:hypothetical protein
MICSLFHLQQLLCNNLLSDFGDFCYISEGFYKSIHIKQARSGIKNKMVKNKIISIKYF